MSDTGKIAKLLTTSRGPQEVQDWMFSLAPLCVAFAFFLVILAPMDMPNKNLVIAIGMAAGFAGLECYWILRGWQKNHIVTILMGITGILVTIALTWLYLAFAWHLTR